MNGTIQTPIESVRKWHALAERRRNHFVELCLDQENGVWVMLHSGSRGVGNKIGMTFIEAAKKEMERYFIKLPDPDLAYLPEASPLFRDYWDAVEWAQQYAKMNRDLMLGAAINAISQTLGFPIITEVAAIDCHHNYVALENHFGQN